MGDAGFILFGPIGREVLAAGTLIFVIFATGGQLLAGQIALASLSDDKLCNVLYTGEHFSRSTGPALCASRCADLNSSRDYRDCHSRV
jgi:hypothetical protein